jgi:hypothetical protein
VLSRKDATASVDESDLDHILEDEPAFDRSVLLLLSELFDLFLEVLLSNVSEGKLNNN